MSNRKASRLPEYISGAVLRTIPSFLPFSKFPLMFYHLSFYNLPMILHVSRKFLLVFVCPVFVPSVLLSSYQYTDSTHSTANIFITCFLHYSPHFLHVYFSNLKPTNIGVGLPDTYFLLPAISSSHGFEQDGEWIHSFTPRFPTLSIISPSNRTPGLRSPEQYDVRAHPQTDPAKIDIWQTGTLAYHLLTGRFTHQFHL